MTKTSATESPTPPSGIEEGMGAYSPPDFNSMDYATRVDFILDVRRRVQEDRSKVSDDEIRDAVRCIIASRAAAPGGGKKKKDAAPKVTLADF